jgi:hypothetical protein
MVIGHKIILFYPNTIVYGAGLVPNIIFKKSFIFIVKNNNILHYNIKVYSQLGLQKNI